MLYKDSYWTEIFCRLNRDVVFTLLHLLGLRFDMALSKRILIDWLIE